MFLSFILPSLSSFPSYRYQSTSCEWCLSLYRANEISPPSIVTKCYPMYQNAEELTISTNQLKINTSYTIIITTTTAVEKRSINRIENILANRTFVLIDKINENHYRLIPKSLWIGKFIH